MKIRFFYIATGEDIPLLESYYMNLFVMADSKVYSDNNQTYESQCSVVGFEDCIMQRPTIGWRIETN